MTHQSRIALAVLFLAAMSLAAAARQPRPGTTTPEAVSPGKRLFVIVAPQGDARVTDQVTQLRRDLPGLAERDVVIVWCADDPAPLVSLTVAALDPAHRRALRRRFGIAAGTFTVLLVGKDGGEKLRSAQVLSLEQLVAAIDAMPMRQAEMHNR